MQGQYGPRFVVEQVNAKTILPSRNKWLVNTNTTQEWHEALKLFTPPPTNGSPDEQKTLEW